ncbi:MAG: hypothetical protein EA381_12920 [Planctomycetaceae bacterium]|nr:MAG: hypothetical protein EA381_12920 [Planctomycetaceae bacterium]
MTDANVELFEVFSNALFYCWIFGFLLILAWVGIFKFSRSFIQRFHGGMFSLSDHELDVISYCGMGLLKLAVILFFFFPWLAIRIMLST